MSPDEERALQLELQARYDADAATVADIVRLEADAAKLEDDAQRSGIRPQCLSSHYWTPGTLRPR